MSNDRPSPGILHGSIITLRQIHRPSFSFLTAAVAASAATAAASLNRATVWTGDIRRLGTIVVAVLNNKLNRLTFSEVAEAIGLDSGLVNEEVLASIVGSDESETLGFVEPFHTSLFKSANRLPRYVKEILGTCVSAGCTVGGKDPTNGDIEILLD